MKLSYLVDANKTYIVAVSFGPDSMCLLDLLQKETNNLIVAHVNYHKRQESNSEQERLEAYCKEKNIRIEVLDTSDLKSEGNFQKWAREIRYEFFAKLEKKYSAECVFIAHQQDDLIETFLMQKSKGIFVKCWGIAEKNTVKHAHIERPLLNFTKEELRQYCEKNNVPYAIDSSNLEDHYSRNKIRHSVVEKMTKEEREKIITEIRDLNANKTNKIEKRIDVNEFVSMSYENAVLFISNYLNANGEHMDLSKEFIYEIQEAFKTSKSTIKIKLINGYELAKEYEMVYIVNTNQRICYHYVLNITDKINDDLFEIDLSQSFEDRNLAKNMFPITVKPVSRNDEYIIKDYKCKIRRLFIDWKVPSHLRESWPGIFDKTGKLVYVPRYKKEYIDNHNSKFVIKFTK